MQETSTPASVSKRAAPKVSATKSRRSTAVARSWIPRPAYVAVAFVLLLTIGWGAFSIIGRQSPDDDEAELADLDGFDAESPSLDEPEHQAQPAPDGFPAPDDTLPRDFTSRPFLDRAHPWSAPSVPDSSEIPALSAIPDQQASRFERVPLAANANQQSTAGAWLIGTIEADDAPERIALPPRVSQAVADGPLFR